MNIMHEFTLKSLKRNKKRTVVTIIGVVISTAMLTAVTVLVSSLLSMIQRSTIAEGGNWHAQISGVMAQNINTVTQSEEVDAAVLSRSLGYAYFGSKNEGRPYLNVREYYAPGFDQMSVRLVSGRLPQKNGEAVISSAIEKSGGVTYAIGDTLELKVGKRIGMDGELFDENTSLQYEYDENGSNPRLAEIFKPEGALNLTVVGVIDPPSFETSWSAGYGVIGLLDEAALAPDDAVDIILTVKNVNRGIFKSIPNLAEQAEAGGEIFFNKELLRYSGVVEQDNVFSFLVNFTAIIVLIIILASVSLIYNAFAISVSERAKQLGLLASIGATKQQKRGGVYFEGFFIGAIGIPIGIAAGIGGIGITIAAIQPLLGSIFSMPRNVTLTLVVPPLAIIAAVILSAVTIFVSAWIPAKRASRIMPIDAIRMTKEVKLTRRTVKTSGVTRALFGFEAEIALKNLKRSRKKYRATIISLALSLVLFLTVSAYTQFATSITRVSFDGVNYDIHVNYSGSSDTIRRNINETIASLKEVKEYTEIKRLSGVTHLPESALSEYAKALNFPENDRYELNADIIGLDDESFGRYAKSAGLNSSDYTNPEDPKAILINHGQDYYPTDNGDLTKVSGDILNIRPGEHLAIKLNDIPETLDVTIGALTEQRPMGIRLQSFNSAVLVVSGPVFDKLMSAFTSEQLADRIGYTTYLTTDDDQQVEKQLSIIAQGSSSVYIWNIKSAARSEQNMQLFLGIFVYGFIILISLICIANIFNTVTTNIALRRREFAMLRSVGMTPESFGRMIRFESIFYGMKGLLYGLPISVAIAYLLFGVQRSVLETSFTLPWMSYAVAIAMILIIVLVTMWYASSKIKKENIMDALKEENT
jgi:putative ABC transport system permease protein